MHAIDRAKERYGLELTIEDLREITYRCRTNTDVTRLWVKNVYGMMPRHKSNDLSGPYRLKYKGNTIFVALNRNREDGKYWVRTFLPKPENPSLNYIDGLKYSQLLKEK